MATKKFHVRRDLLRELFTNLADFYEKSPDDESWDAAIPGPQACALVELLYNLDMMPPDFEALRSWSDRAPSNPVSRETLSHNESD
jgi:hypothetical protein